MPPLDMPEPGTQPRPSDLRSYEAAVLFRDRATAVDPGFALTEHNAEVVAKICALLDGLPLAIELAASRVRVLSAEAMVERLDRSLSLLAGGPRDLPARQRTLRGAFAWSHDLLGDEQQALFRRLAVFAGGFNLESAQAVCDPHGDLGIDLLDGIDALLETSLVRRRTDQPGEVRKRVSLFRELSPADLKHVAEATSENVYVDGTIIAEQGEPGDAMHIVVSGHVRVMLGRHGRTDEVARRGPGYMVGEMSILGEQPRMANLVAEGDVRTLSIDRRRFQRILRERPDAALAVMRELSARLREAHAERPARP